ncbi:MAG: hypothetical protein ACI9LM_002001 [Alteromonadaceae bacterium]|jgi:hypothetical protein
MFKKLAIKKYANKLLTTLKKRYGDHDKYSASQIRETIYKCGFNPKYLPLAYILHLQKEQITATLGLEFPHLNIASFRKEVCDCYSIGNIQTSFEIF